MANRPINKWRSGQLELAVWLNERELKDGNIVGFKTLSLRKSWKDDQGVWRDATIQLRKHDIQRVLVLMNKAQEELLLQTDEKENSEDDEDE